MSKTQYAYAVARIRALEVSLFSSSTIEQLIACKDEEAALPVGVGLTAPLDGGELVVELLGDLADLVVGDGDFLSAHGVLND